MTKVHDLKCWPDIFEVMNKKIKTFDLRKNDRDFKINDILVLHEYDPNEKKYTGNVISRKVIYILYGGRFGLPKDYCIMQLGD